MSERQTKPFRGFLDMTSEMNRMRQLGMYGYETGQEERERTHATAWVPTADVFRRSTTLPSGIDENRISADFDNGLMEVTVRGGATAVEPRRIEIRSKPG